MTLELLSGRWDEVGHLAAVVRIAVFVEEQRIPREEEWDEQDLGSVHFVAVSGDGEPVGTARLTEDAHIGRMAVLPEWRRNGVGRLLLEAAVETARGHGHSHVELSAQLQAAGFYEKLGFQAYGEVYHEVGIPHRRMRRPLGD